MKKFVAALCLVSTLCGQDAKPPAEAPFDVGAERARRDAAKRAQQQAEVDRMKKVGEPFQIKYVVPKFPAGIAKDVYVVQISAVIHIDETGMVRGIRIESPPNPPFDWAVVEAVWQWRFSPKKDLGKPVPVDLVTKVAVARPGVKRDHPAARGKALSGGAISPKPHLDNPEFNRRTLHVTLSVQERRLARTSRAVHL